MPHHARCVSSFRLGIRISSGCGKVFPGASLPGRLSLLAGLRPASPGPAVLIRGDDPPDPHERGWGWFCHWRRDGPPDPHERGWGWFCHWRRDGPPDPHERGWGWFCHWRRDGPPDPHERGWGWFCHWRRDGPPDPHERGWGWFCHWRRDGPPDPHDRGSGWFCHWRRDGPPDPHDRGSGWFCHWRRDGPPDPHGAGSLLWHPALVVAGGAWATLACRWRFATCGGTDTPGTPRCEGCAVTGHAAPGRELLLSQPGGWSLPLTVGRSPV